MQATGGAKKKKVRKRRRKLAGAIAAADEKLRKKKKKKKKKKEVRLHRHTQSLNISQSSVAGYGDGRARELPWLRPLPRRPLRPRLRLPLRPFLSFIFLWTGPSKLLLLCWDAGLDYSASGFLYFVAVVLFPIRVRGLKPPKHAAAAADHDDKHPFLAFWQLVAAVAILNIYTFRDRLPLSLIYLLYGFHIYQGLELILGGLAKLVQTFFGLESDPQFNNPFMSASLSEFWGKRWNLVVTTILRSTVYNPALLLLKPAPKQKMQESDPNALHACNSRQAKTDQETSEEKPTLRARALALLATFLVSGLIHELIFYYISKSPATGEVTAFFILHGFATAVEVALRRSFPSLTRMPRAMSIFTLAFVYISAAWLFMPPLTRAETDIRTIAEYHQLQSTLMSLFRR